MKIAVAPENVVERLVLAAGAAPVTLMDTHVSFMRARAIMVATKLGVFDALAAAPLDATEIAARCQTNPRATEKLLGALVGSGYLEFIDRKYGLSAVARQWVVSDAPHSLRDKILFEFLEWTFVERFEEYVRTGQPLELHHTVSGTEWQLYQRAMRALAGLGAPEVVRRTPVPAGATAMIDIGGSHGFVSVSLCRKYPTLKAVVLDLPEAVEQAAPLLAAEGMGERVSHWAADALTADLGRSAWDLVFVSQLLHHFSADASRALIQRAAESLRPGGVLAIVELVRPASPAEAGQVGSLLNLYFALTSRAGTWSIQEIVEWQRAAGLAPRKPIVLRTTPGAVELVALKPNG